MPVDAGVARRTWLLVVLAALLAATKPAATQNSPLAAQARAAKQQGWSTLILPMGGGHADYTLGGLYDMAINGALLVTPVRINAAQTFLDQLPGISPGIITWHVFRIEQTLAPVKPVPAGCTGGAPPVDVASDEIAVLYGGGAAIVDGVTITAVSAWWDGLGPENGARYVMLGGRCPDGRLPWGLPDQVLPGTRGSIEAVRAALAAGPPPKEPAAPVRNATITGTIVDDRGEPAVGVTVRALPQAVTASQSTVTLSHFADTRTDDRGTFTLRVAPDSYRILAVVSNTMLTVAEDESGQRTYPNTYYPGTLTSGSAHVLQMRANDTATANIRMTTVPVFNVAGTLRSESGLLASGLSMLLTGAGDDALDFPTRRVNVRTDGTFEFRTLRSGRYSVTVEAGTVTLAQLPPITVDLKNVADLDLRLADPLLHVLGRDQPDPAPARGTAKVTGVVRLAGTGEPLNRVRVLVRERNPRPMSHSTLTDALGRYTLKSLPAGSYELVTERESLIPVVDAGDTRSITVADSESREVNATMARGGAFGGTVFDSSGQPLPDAELRLWKVPTKEDPSTMLPANMLGGGGRSDGRGGYRYFGVPSGQDLMSATPQLRQDRPRPLPVFYPGTLNVADALVVSVEAGREVGGSIDIHLVAAAPVTVSGRVSLRSGQWSGYLSLDLYRTDSPVAGIVSDPLLRRTERDGRFQLGGVPPGRYMLIAQANSSSPTGIRYWAKTEVTVGDRDIADLNLVMEPPTTIEGCLAIEGRSELQISAIRLSVTPMDLVGTSATPLSRAARIDPNHQFVIENIIPATYRFWIGPSSGTAPIPWTIASVQIDGNDVGDGFAITADAPPRNLTVILRER